jgi:hypothetical protein
MKPIEIFRAGTHISNAGNKVTITTADLAACAAAYDTSLYQAPLVVGHPKNEDPAFGWIKSIEVKGDVLVGVPDEVNPAFAQMVADGAFKNRSAAFWSPTDAQNPVPGKWSLKHAGFLGAAPPAVFGLKPVAFAAADTAVEFANWNGLTIARLFANIRDWMISRDGLDKANEVLSADDIAGLQFDAAQPDRGCDDDTPQPAFSQGDDMTEAEKAQLQADKDKLAAERVEFAQEQKKLRKSHLIVFVDGLIAAGKVATGHKDALVEFMAGLPQGDEATFEFSQADGAKTKADPTDWFKGFMTALPPIVPLGERAPHDPAIAFSQGAAPVIDPGEAYRIHNRVAK